jgi:hypothetical protein
MSQWGRNGQITTADAGAKVDLGESWLEVLLRGAESDGQFGAFVFHHAAIAENPPHAHQDFAKVLYILDGQYGQRRTTTPPQRKRGGARFNQVGLASDHQWSSS